LRLWKRVIAVARSTRLEAEGAEFLVLGSLLAEGISAWKAYTNFPGYDVIAGDAAAGKLCRIQVKSRYHTGHHRFPIRNFDCDFVCFVQLNRGYQRARKSGDDGVRPPDIWVLPIKDVQRVRQAKRAWGYGVTLSRLGDWDYLEDQYLVNWNLVKKFLRGRRRTS
jgi:hypothetical protein